MTSARRPGRLACCIASVLLGSVLAASAQDTPLLFLAPPSDPVRATQARAPEPSGGLDLAPLVRRITAALAGYGIPLREDAALAGEGGIALTARFAITEDIPLQFRVGDRAPLGAFYEDDGFRWALSWSPGGVPHISVHLEGGTHSEFGHAALGGIQWRSADSRLAIGIGVPLLVDRDEAAMLWQIRLRFD